MIAVRKDEIRDDAAVRNLLDLHQAEIRRRDSKIEQFVDLLERQARELAIARAELGRCRAQLERVAV